MVRSRIEGNEVVEDTLSSDLARAFEQIEGDEDETDGGGSTGDVHPGTDSAEVGESSSAAEENDEGTDTAGDDTSDRSEAEETADKEETVDASTEKTGEETPADDLDTPPSSLPPEAREVWKDTPKEVREAMAERERQYTLGLQKNADAAKQFQAMNRTLAPFQQFFAMQGAPVPQTVGSVLQTAARLQMGTPVQKAQTVAQLIEQFGVDGETLANVLEGTGGQQNGQQTSQQQPSQQPQQPPVDPYQAANQVYQQYQRQQADQQVGQELETFAKDPKHEFYNDVAMDMADFIDGYANRGRNLTLDEAYDMACHANPRIRQILANRQQAQDATRRQAAASSVSGAPSGSAAPPDNEERLDTIKRVWESAGRV